MSEFNRVLALVSDLLRTHDADFTDQTAHPVIGGGALLDESLPCAVQAEDDSLDSRRTITLIDRPTL